MRVKDPNDGGNNTYYTWTEDNRLSQVARQGAGQGGATLTTQFAYDYQGARILRRDNDTTRRRYFFNGITEQVVKESASGWAQDSAFAFTAHEDGESAAGQGVDDFSGVLAIDIEGKNSIQKIRMGEKDARRDAF